jgi:quinol monooxygenase YgiN
VLGEVTVDPSDTQTFLRDIAAIDPSGGADSGCLSYSVSAADKAAGRMLVAERWLDELSLRAHLRSAAVAAFGERWSGRMQGEVRVYDAANERPLPV